MLRSFGTVGHISWKQDVCSRHRYRVFSDASIGHVRFREPHDRAGHNALKTVPFRRIWLHYNNKFNNNNNNDVNKTLLCPLWIGCRRCWASKIRGGGIQRGRLASAGDVTARTPAAARPSRPAAVRFFCCFFFSIGFLRYVFFGRYVIVGHGRRRYPAGKWRETAQDT